MKGLVKFNKEMMGANKEKNQKQGKKATSETDMTYNRDAAGLKNSATTSMADFDSGGSEGASGGRVEAIRENSAGDSEKEGSKP